ncbi:MAG: cytochrome P450 [Solirubrobacteraceae bacterium]
MTLASAPLIDLHDRLRSYLGGDPAALVDPYPLFRDLREAGAVHDLGTTVVISRYDAVKAVLLDASRLSSRTFVGSRVEEMQATMTGEERSAFDELVRFDSNSVQHTDSDRHGRLRRIVGRSFTPRRIELLRARVEEFTNELIASLDAQGIADLREFSYQLPLKVVVDLLDAPQSMMPAIRRWSEAIGESRGITTGARVAAAARALTEFRAYVESLAAELRNDPRDGSLVGTLIDAEAEEQLTTEELTTMFIVILFAGHETTTNLLSIGLLDLLRHPVQWQRLCAAPGATAPSAVEELLRYSNPVQTINRVAIEDVEIVGSRIPERRAVVGLLGAANRDPAAFEDPDTLDVCRVDVPHLGLGHGPHFCLGSALTRLEAQTAFVTLATRFPDMELAVAPDELTWAGNAMLRKIETLPIALNA